MASNLLKCVRNEAPPRYFTSANFQDKSVLLGKDSKQINHLRIPGGNPGMFLPEISGSRLDLRRFSALAFIIPSDRHRFYNPPGVQYALSSNASRNPPQENKADNGKDAFQDGDEGNPPPSSPSDSDFCCPATAFPGTHPMEREASHEPTRGEEAVNSGQKTRGPPVVEAPACKFEGGNEEDPPPSSSSPDSDFCPLATVFQGPPRMFSPMEMETLAEPMREEEDAEDQRDGGRKTSTVPVVEAPEHEWGEENEGQKRQVLLPAPKMGCETDRGLEFYQKILSLEKIVAGLAMGAKSSQSIGQVQDLILSVEKPVAELVKEARACQSIGRVQELVRSAPRSVDSLGTSTALPTPAPEASLRAITAPALANGCTTVPQSGLPARKPEDPTERRTLVAREIRRTLKISEEVTTGNPNASMAYGERHEEMVNAWFGYEFIGWPKDVPLQSLSQMGVGVKSVVNTLYDGLRSGRCYWAKIPDAEHERLREKYGMNGQSEQKRDRLGKEKATGEEDTLAPRGTSAGRKRKQRT
ncbi:hypothetical protein DFH07DRAFT_768254 [Mycena maculata]|uniref:Uncharacterized protein n=1 Tax=Mycena maculata TaxID=230809 RepID=A0AAD7JT13_9AGAR|nr:hypothetical protein DFH07DRAFT_768254 [Mycena maculata]